MGRPSVTSPSGRLRQVRADGTPVYTYAERPGVPPVSVVPMHDGEAPAPLATHQGHTHDFHVLVYVAAGPGHESAGIRVGDRRVRLRPGSLHSVPPGQVVTAEALHELTGTLAWSVAFTPAAVPTLASLSPLAWEHHPLLALFAGNGADAEVPPADRPRWETWLADLAEETSTPTRTGSHEAATALLTRILVASARLAPPDEARAQTSADPLVTGAFEQIEATFRDPVTATEIAHALGYTPGHLTTVLRQRTGRTLLDWLTERRLTEARRLLRETDLPLGVVAARCGFGDAGYLVRRFRARYGITPGRWRTGRDG